MNHFGNRVLLGILVASLAVSLGACGSGAPRLAFQFHKGESQEYEILQTEETEGIGTTVRKLESVLNLACTEEKNNGSYLLRGTFEWFRLHSENSFSGNYSVDTRKELPRDSGAQAACTHSILKVISGLELIISVNELGEIAEIRGFEGIADKLIRVVPRNQSAQMEEQKALLEETYNDNYFKNLFFLPRLPAKGASPGNEWEYSFETLQPLMGIIAHKVSSVLKEDSSSNFSTIEFSGELSLKKPSKGVQGLVMGFEKGEYTGHSKFDKQAGRFLTAGFTRKLTGDVMGMKNTLSSTLEVKFLQSFPTGSKKEAE